LNPSTPFIHRPVATGLLTCGVVLLGLVAYRLLPIASLPQVDFPTVQVSATLPGASAETMSATVASPLEQQFSQIPGLTQMTSSSTLGSTQVTLQFDLARNIDGAAQDVQTAINAAGGLLPKSLPSPPTYHKVNPAQFKVMTVALTSDSVPLRTMAEYANIFIAQRLSQIPGVGLVDMPGTPRPAIRIQVDPAKIAAMGLSLEDVRNAIGTATVNGPKGTLDDAERSVTLDSNDQLLDPSAADATIVAYRGGAPIRVRDIGHALDGVDNVRLAGWFGKQRAVLVDLHLQPGANTVSTVDQIKAALPQLQQHLPPSIRVQIAGDLTQTIRAAVADVQMTLVLTIGLVVLVIFLFLRNLSATVIPSVTIPVSLLGTCVFMYLLGYSLDNLSLMGLTIAVGFVVDDAIVVIENIMRHVEHGERPLEAAITGSREVGFTVVSMTFSLIAVFIPLLLMSGIVGRLFREFSITISVALLVSAFISLTLTPMMCARMIGSVPPPDAGKRGFGSLLERAFARLQAGYGRSLEWVLTHPRLIFTSFLATVALTAYLFVSVPKGFLPQEDVGMILGSTEAAQDISYTAMAEKQQALDDVVLSDPDVAGITSIVGGAGAPNAGRIFIALKPFAQRRATADDVINRLRPKVASVRGISLSMQAVQDINIGGRLARTQYQYTLQDPDLPELYKWSDALATAFAKLPQLRDVTSDLQASSPHASIVVDRDTASRLGITPQLIDDTLYDAFGQRQVATIFTQLDQFKIVLEVDPSVRLDGGALDRIFVATSSGQQVPLSAVAKVGSSVAPLAVNHQGLFPAVTLSFNLAPGGSLGEAVAAIKAAETRIGLPATVQTGFQGTAQAFQDSLATVPLLILAAIIAVYIVLGILYESMIHPVTILSTLPSAGVGALAALMLMGMPFDTMALIGVILLIGIVKKNAIMMVDFAIQAERTGLSALEAIHNACLLRFRPIMMTTLCALLGALPLALGHGPGSELRRPLGIAVVGGLLVSQILTLYTTPVIYLVMERVRAGLARLWALTRQRISTTAAAATVEPAE
jgi:HAE1 family hydrophobic/amphiphilic exporter-1/multidrug efflux pump